MAGKIGPHEGIEHLLLLSGEKKIAYFCDALPVECEELVSTLDFNLMSWHWNIDGNQISSNIIYRTGHEAAAERLRDLVGKKEFDSETEHEIGEILGYTVEDVEAFLSRVKRLVSGGAI